MNEREPGIGRAFGTLTLLGLLSFGVFIPRLGFYSDDWWLLEIMSSGRRLGAIAGWIRNGGLWTRPVEMFQYSFFYLIGGPHASIQQTLLFIFGLLECWLLFLLFFQLLRHRSLALTAAMIAYLYPNRAVFHIWFADSPELTAHLLALASLLIHIQWRNGAGRVWLIWSLALFLAAILSYESVVFLPLLLGVTITFDNRSPVEGATEGIATCLPYLLPIAIAFVWQWVGARWLLGHMNPKAQELRPSIGHFLKVYGAGFECITNRTLHLCVKNIAAMRFWGWQRWITCAAALTTVLVCARTIRHAESPSRAELKRTLILSAVIFIVGYAPYALSGSYTPQIFGIMSRTNGIGAWSGGLLIAALLGFCRPRLRSALLALVLVLFTGANWVTNFEWAQAWVLENDILTKLVPTARNLPPKSKVVLVDAPHFSGYAVVFDSSYDFDSALRVSTRRRDLDGFVAPTEPNDAYRYSYAEGSWRTPGKS